MFIVVDGPGKSGKKTLVENLTSRLSGNNVLVHTLNGISGNSKESDRANADDEINSRQICSEQIRDRISDGYVVIAQGWMTATLVEQSVWGEAAMDQVWNNYMVANI